MSSERSVWALSSGSYSSYHVIAIFEAKADAETVMAEMLSAPGDNSWYDVQVEEFPYYATGDTSLRPTSHWMHCVEVHPDGVVAEIEPVDDRYTINFPHEMALLADETPEDQGVVVRRTFGHNPPSKVYGVYGVGRTKEQAIKGAKDRAAEVAAMVLEGLDPREVERARRSDR